MHNQIPMNQIMEMTINRFSKKTGRLSRVTEKKGTSERWVRINHFIAVLRKHLDVKLGKNHKYCNIEMGCKKKKSDEEEFRNVTKEIHSMMINIWCLYKLVTKFKNGMFADAEMVLHVLSSHEEKEKEIAGHLLSRFTTLTVLQI